MVVDGYNHLQLSITMGGLSWILNMYPITKLRWCWDLPPHIRAQEINHVFVDINPATLIMSKQEYCSLVQSYCKHFIFLLFIEVVHVIFVLFHLCYYMILNVKMIHWVWSDAEFSRSFTNSTRYTDKIVFRTVVTWNIQY